MTKQLSNTAGAPVRTLIATVAISPLLLTSCLTRSDRETIDIPPPVGDVSATPATTAPAGTLSDATATPATPTPPPYALDSAVKYVVQPGDSLSLIAAKHNTSTGDVMKVNKIKNANKIRIGQTLLLPGEEKEAAEAPVETAAEAVTETGTETTEAETETPTITTTPPATETGGLTLPGE